MSDEKDIRLILEPIVELVASTVTDEAAIDRWLSGHDTTWTAGRGGNTRESIVEAAGRGCYWSYEKGRDSPAFFGNILDSRHFSVLEHTSFAFAISGVSRSLTHELVRHRYLQPSQLSQRYCDQVDPRLGLGLVVPPAMMPWHAAWEAWCVESDDEDDDIPSLSFEDYKAFDAWLDNGKLALTNYASVLGRLASQGHDRKTAHDAARYILPEACETRLFLSGNARSWLEALPKRTDPAAAMEIGRLAHILATKLKEAAPLVFRDLGTEG